MPNKMILMIFGILFFHWPAYSSPDKDSQARVFEEQFLSNLHQANQEEIAMGRLAEQKGATAEVRDYGSRLVKDHLAADRKVMEVAKADRLDISEEPHHHHEMKQLRALNGPPFDERFKEMMVAGHRQTIKEVSDAMSKLSDPNVMNLAKNLLPTLREHERIAKNLPSPTTGARTAMNTR